jgi:hypothetical protein
MRIFLLALVFCTYSFGFVSPVFSKGGVQDEAEGDLSVPSLTIYNSDFALVKETISLDLKEGFNDLSYEGATMTLEPTSVVLTPLYGDEEDDYRYEEDDYKPTIVVAEQSYRNDILTPSYMLSLFEGKSIDFLVDLGEGRNEVVSGKVVRSGYASGGAPSDPIIELQGKVRFGLPGIPLFPSLGDDTLFKPRLEWQIFSSQTFQGEANLSYLTEGISWQASYNLVLPQRGVLASLNGLITISNNCGRDFLKANLELMAGEVSRDRGHMLEKNMMAPRAMAVSEAMDGAGVTQKPFDEFHLYTLPVPVTLRDKEIKQVEFVSASSVSVETIYRVSAQQLYHGNHGIGSVFHDSPDITTSAPTHVTVLRRIANSDSNQLGIPLPSGMFRIYRKDEEGIQFVGESRIEHTPKNEIFEVVTGKAFDVLAKRTRTQFEVGDTPYLGKRTMTESFEYILTNRKDEDIVVNVVDYLRGPNWKITSETHPHKKTSAAEVQWEVEVEADSQVKLTYTVVYSW